MQTAPRRFNEAESLKALRDLEVLDTGPELEFDALTHAAAGICGTPMALMSLVDAERQWFKANVGLEAVPETVREVSFCAHAVLADELFLVEDATQDSRFADSPLVLDEPRIRFYAGAPLRLANGLRIGTLCVLDHRPRQLSQVERVSLERLATAVVRALEGRFAVRKLKARAERAPVAGQTFVENALVNIDGAMEQLVSDNAKARSSRSATNPKLNAMHFCLTSAVALLGITHRLLQPEQRLSPFEQEHEWKQLAEDTKVAGRAAYRAALALSDPNAEWDAAHGA